MRLWVSLFNKSASRFRDTNLNHHILRLNSYFHVNTDSIFVFPFWTFCILSVLIWVPEAPATILKISFSRNISLSVFLNIKRCDIEFIYITFKEIIKFSVHWQKMNHNHNHSCELKLSFPLNFLSLFITAVHLIDCQIHNNKWTELNLIAYVNISANKSVMLMSRSISEELINFSFICLVKYFNMHWFT